MKMKGTSGCEGGIYEFSSNRTEIKCQETEGGLHICKKIFKKVEGKLENTDEAYIGTKECLVNLFEGDESVEDRLINKNAIGTTRNKLNYEMGYDVPRQALVVTDHDKFSDLLSHEINREISTTLFHEDEHLGGLKGTEEEEEMAEERARRRYIR